MYIFISSTFVDLRAERAKVIEALQKGEALPWGMEFFVSTPDQPLALCLNELDRSDAVILLIGSRAGSLVPNASGLTYTEAEIERARTRGVPLFTFIKTVGAALPNEHEPSDPLHAKLNAFRDAASNIGTPAYFETIDVLATNVLAAVTRWEKAGRPGARRVFATGDEFFRLETPPQKLLRHDVTLYGRSKEVDELNAFRRDDAAVLMLTAEGGAGKSKLLHDWTQSVRDCSILFVKPGALWHGEAIRELPDGPILIVFDDAHQEPSLVESVTLLLRQLRQHRHAKLVIATRPSGADQVRAAITRRFGSEEIRSLRLEPLTLEDRRRIAEMVLGSDYVHLRDHLVEVAGQSPLVLVVAGRIIASGEADPGALLSMARFSDEILNRFIEELGSEADTWRPLLNLLALVGPTHAHAETFLAAASQVLGLPPDEIHRGVRVLEARGLIGRRGSAIRVIPDVLADRLVRVASADETGRPTGYVDRVYELFGLTYIENVLASVAELTWRLSQEGHQSPLLDRIWADLRQRAADTSWHRSEVLRAVRAAAVYQPDHAFAFAQAASELGLERGEHDEVAEIVRVVAYHPRYTAHAFDELWPRAIVDERPTNAYPSHAARLLTELAGYAPFKSGEFSERILELARPRMRDPGAFSGPFTPLDLADAVLEREAEIHEGTETGITLRAAALNYRVVQPLRSRAIDMIREALFMNEPAAQMRAVKSVSKILYGFLPAFGRRQSDEEREWQDDERLQMLDLVEERLRATPSTALRLALLRELESSVAPGESAVDLRTRAILDRYELGTDGLLLSAFCVPSWDERTVREHEEQVRVNRERLTVAHGLFKERVMARGGDPVRVFEELVATASEFGLLEGTAASTFVLQLCEDAEFLALLTQRAFREPTSPSTPFLSAAIRKIAAAGVDEFRQVARAALESGHERLVSAAAHAVVGMPFDRPTAADVDLLWLAALRGGRSYRRAAFYSIGRMAEASPELREATIGRLATIDLPDNKTADDVCAAVARVLPSLTREHATRLLERLVAPFRLDEHWIGEVLEWCTNMHADLVVKFVLARFAEEGRRKAARDYGYVAPPDQLRRHDFTGIRNGPTYASALRQLRDALLDPDVSSSAVDLFWRIGQLDVETLGALDEWLHADRSHAEALAPVIRNCHQPIALERPMFALHACQAAAAIGGEAAERIASAFVGNAMPNQWSHAPGTVPPAFAEVAERARRIHEMLGAMPCSELLRTIEDEAIRRGRSNAEDY
jgi:hypothetical protein